jgi:hypothetical protein
MSGVLSAGKPPGAWQPVRDAAAAQGSLADHDEEDTEDKAAEPESYRRRRADQPHPEDVHAEPEVGRLGRGPDRGRPERDGGHGRQRERVKAYR